MTRTPDTILMTEELFTSVVEELKPQVTRVEQAKIRAAEIRAQLLPHGVVMADVFHPRYLELAKVSEAEMAEWILTAEVPELPPGPPMMPFDELVASAGAQEAL
jgi:hypothetical protein